MSEFHFGPKPGQADELLLADNIAQWFGEGLHPKLRCLMEKNAGHTKAGAQQEATNIIVFPESSDVAGPPARKNTGHLVARSADFGGRNIVQFPALKHKEIVQNTPRPMPKIPAWIW